MFTLCSELDEIQDLEPLNNSYHNGECSFDNNSNLFDIFNLFDKFSIYARNRMKFSI